MNRFFIIPAASSISRFKGLSAMRPFPTRGYVRSSCGSSDSAWFCRMVHSALIPGRMLLRPPPKPAMTWYVAAPRQTQISARAAMPLTATSVPKEVVPSVTRSSPRQSWFTTRICS